MRTALCVVPDQSWTPEWLVVVRTSKHIEKGGEMAFSESMRHEIFMRAHGRCEKCGKTLVYEHHREGERGAWEAHHRTSVDAGGKDIASNGMALCLDCHKSTYTYGGK